MNGPVYCDYDENSRIKETPTELASVKRNHRKRVVLNNNKKAIA